MVLEAKTDEKSSKREACERQLVASDISRIFEGRLLPPSGVEKWMLLLGGPSNRLFATTMYIL